MYYIILNFHPTDFCHQTALFNFSRVKNIHCGNGRKISVKLTIADLGNTLLTFPQIRVDTEKKNPENKEWLL